MKPSPAAQKFLDYLLFRPSRKSIRNAARRDDQIEIQRLHKERKTDVDSIVERINARHHRVYFYTGSDLRDRGIKQPYSIAGRYARHAAQVEGKKVMAEISARLHAEVDEIRAHTQLKLARLDARGAVRTFGPNSKPAKIQLQKLREAEDNYLCASAMLVAIQLA